MKRRTAFTLIELLVVVTIILILAALLFPVFSGMREKSRQLTCLSNMRQLAQSWMACAMDRKGDLPGSNPRVRGNWLDSQETGNGGTNMITMGALYPYVGSIKPYRCPSATTGTLNANRLCSYAMNGQLNSSDIANASALQIFRNLTTLNRQILLFVEESDTRNNNINIGSFGIGKNFYGKSGAFGGLDAPAWGRHNGNRMNLVFVDGHGEMWQAKDPRSPLESWAVAYDNSNPLNPDVLRFFQAFWGVGGTLSGY